jgi:hypothetical protein
MANAREIVFEEVIGRRVVDEGGYPVGRIADAQIEPDGDDYVVTGWIIGPIGRLARLRAFLYHLPPLHALGIGRPVRNRTFRWEWIDLSDPQHPTLRSADD